MSDAGQSTKREWIQKAVERHAGPLTRYAASITGDEESARDVVQETFLRLCRAERARIEGHLVPWLFRVCRTRALEHANRERRMTDLSDRTLEQETSPDTLPSDAAERSEAVRSLLQILDTLPAKQREVIRLRFQNGLSYKEIAEATSTSVNNVGFTLHTALKTLHTKIKGETGLLAGDCPYQR